MNVTCTETIPQLDNAAIFDINTVYAAKNRPQLIQQYCTFPKSDFFDIYYRRFSEDNGNTWSSPEIIFEPEVTPEGSWRYSESALFYDQDQDIIVFFYNYALFPTNHYSHERDKTMRIFYRLSTDNGKSFSEPVQLITNDFDEINWAPGITYGSNCAMVSFCAPVKIQDQIFLPVAISPQETESQNNLHSLSAACFIGTWQGKNIQWKMSETLKIPPDLSARGLCEPTIAELEDGRLLMVMRGSNGGGYGVVSDVPSYKWYAVSNDCGKNWDGLHNGNHTSIDPWIYSNGESFYSPASGSRLIRSSENEKLYWLGNITDKNPQGNLPRRPLVVAEIDESTGCPIKESVRIVADKKNGQSENIQFSNFRVYEDYQTKEFVITMPHIGALNNGSVPALASPGYSHRFYPCQSL